MAMYATPTELAGYLQQDLDTYTATQALTLASAEFNRAADTAFTPTNVTWTTDVWGHLTVELPFYPVTAVSAVRVNGVTATGWSLRNGRIWRPSGFGFPYSWQLDVLEVDLTYGYASVPDDVKLAVLEIAAANYEHPSTAISEQIDDYRTQYDPEHRIGPAGRPWQDVAASYRRLLVA